MIFIRKNINLYDFDNFLSLCNKVTTANTEPCEEFTEPCEEFIPENHLGAGNEEKKDCPNAPGSKCVINKKSNQGNVTFHCINEVNVKAKWILVGK